jgi:membrane fusion protein (multidrug efflux system)
MMGNSRKLGRWVLALAAVLAVSAAGWSTVRGRTAEPARGDAPAALEFLEADLLTVAAGDFSRTLRLTGTLSPLVEAAVKARIPGELVEVAVREGDAVRKGQAVARIDQTEVQARLAARAADVEAAHAQLGLAEKNRAMQRKLLDQNFISRNAFDTTQSNHDVALARLRAAEAEYAVARKSLSDAVLVAPFSGIVAERLAQPGERVSLDARVLTIVDLSRLELEASLPASAISEVRIGQSIAFRVDGFGEREFAGRIERINPTASAGSRSIAVYASVDNPDGALRGGLFAQGSLTLQRIGAALSVPASATREESGRRYVYAIAKGVVERREVRLGDEDGAGRVNVLAGLQAGDVIVRNNLGPLREGATARVVQPRASK